MKTAFLYFYTVLSPQKYICPLKEPSHTFRQVNIDREDLVLQFCTHKGVPNAA